MENKKYSIIYADPPWAYRIFIRKVLVGVNLK